MVAGSNPAPVTTMLQISFIYNNKKKVIVGLNKRNFDKTNLINKITLLYSIFKITQSSLSKVSHYINNLNKIFNNILKCSKGPMYNQYILLSIKLKIKIQYFKKKIKQIEKEIFNRLIFIPNIPHIMVKKGSNEIIYKKKYPLLICNNKLKHWELAKNFKIFDIELGVKISGSGFTVYTQLGAKLNRALIQYFLDKNILYGYNEYILPYLVNKDTVYLSGQFPDKENQMYNFKNYYLIPTGEVPLLNCFSNKILQEVNLPIKATTHTVCFRREAGSYGSYVKSLNRLHQFDKVEIIQITTQDSSYTILEDMVEHVKNILKELKLTFRIFRLCGGNLGFTSAMTYDFEVYSSVQKKWLEVSSISNCTDFQTYRMKLRYRSYKGKIKFCHALNGSALALPRILAALIENNQDNNHINIPSVLIPYTGFDKIMNAIS